jgi:hypothetical protein
LMSRVRTRLGVSGRNDPALSALLGRRLASRTAMVRWDEPTGLALLVGSDPDVRAAVGLFGTSLR